MSLLDRDIKRCQVGDIEVLDHCNTYNKDGKLDTNDCIDCPLWFGLMQGGCCKALKQSAKYSKLRAEASGGVPQRKAMIKRLKTLADFLEAQKNDKE